jgi:hypothetical protein
VFFFRWSVNWQFLGEEVATGKVLAKYLLIAHLSLLVIFLLAKWSPFSRGFGLWFHALRLPELLKNCKPKALDPRFVAL